MTTKIDLNIQEAEQNLQFTIHRMRPTQLERWLRPALALLVRNPEAKEEDYRAAGKKLARDGIWNLVQAGDMEAIQKLNDELLGCCSRVLGQTEQRCTPDSVDAFINEVETLFTLKNAALRLNLDYLLDGDASVPSAGNETRNDAEKEPGTFHSGVFYPASKPRIPIKGIDYDLAK